MAKKRIFISYCSSTDQQRMILLRDRLNLSAYVEPVVVPQKRSGKAVPQADKVKAALKSADYVVPILTKGSLSTQWLNQEIGFCEAMGTEMWPIVDSDIMNDLKGFIHRELDLSYRFHGTLDPDDVEFEKQCDLLARDLDEKLKVPKAQPLPMQRMRQNMPAAELFPGKWQNSYSTKRTSAKFRSEVFEIRNGNQYWKDDEPVFDIVKLKIDPQTLRVSFTKSDVRTPGRMIEAVLTSDKPGKFSGIETGNGPARKVKYTQIA